MSALLAGLPADVPGATLNRLCGSGLDAIASASRMIKTGEAELVLAGGVESMSRAPYVMSKGATPFSRDVQMFDTTIGWRFVNPLMKKQYGVDSMPETGENVAEDFDISREDQDRFALRSQQRALGRARRRAFREEIVGVTIPSKRGEATGRERGRASARNEPRGARQSCRRRSAPAVRYRRQCVRRQRWRLRAGDWRARPRRSAWPHAAGSQWSAPRWRESRRASWASGPWRRRENFSARLGLSARRHGCHRAQRGVCLASARGAARSRISR